MPFRSILQSPSLQSRLLYKQVLLPWLLRLLLNALYALLIIGIQALGGLIVHILINRAVMPFKIVLHEINAAALIVLQMIITGFSVAASA